MDLAIAEEVNRNPHIRQSAEAWQNNSVAFDKVGNKQEMDSAKSNKVKKQCNALKKEYSNN